jgi:hypothetical protein
MALVEPIPPDSSNLEKAFEALSLVPPSHLHRSQAISVLATESRESPEVRERLAERHILRTLVDAAECGLQDDIETTSVALRCIGNACINDAGRQHITEIGFSWASNCLAKGDASIQLLTAKALRNICFEYEAAQQQCYRERIHHGSIRLCAQLGYARSPERSLVADVLFDITAQRSEAEKRQSHPASALVDPKDEGMPHDILPLLLSLPPHYGIEDGAEDLATVTESVLVYLRDPEIQSRIVAQRLVEQVWDILKAIEVSIQEASEEHDGDEEDEEKQLLVPLATSLTWCLSDIAAEDTFAQQYNLGKDLIRELLRCIQSSSSSEDSEIAGTKPGKTYHPKTNRITTAACQIVGNLLWRRPVIDSAALVEPERLHTSLYQIILTTNDTELLHAAAGLLVQLTRPSPDIRDTMGKDPNAEAALSKLCLHGTLQLKQDGIKLLKALGKECPANMERFTKLAAQAMNSAVEADPSAQQGDTIMSNALN